MRTHSLTKLGRSDWLCPSNDRTLLWRFQTYQDGRGGGLMNVDYEWRTFWMASKVPMPNLDRLHSLDDIIDLPWEVWYTGCTTRRDALESVYGKE